MLLWEQFREFFIFVDEGASLTGMVIHTICASQVATEIKPCAEIFVSNLLRRRWILENPETKIHRINLLRKHGPAGGGIFLDIDFSIDTRPHLGNTVKEQRGKEPGFYVVRDDLLHPFVNGNKARKLDAILPIVEQYSCTDVVTCGGCQSAHATAVAVSCADRGLRSHLLLRGEEPEILTGYNLISSMFGKVVYVPRSLYADRQAMLMSHAEIVAGPCGSVEFLDGVLDILAQSNREYGTLGTTNDRRSNSQRKVVILNEGAGDAVSLLGVIRLVQHLSQAHILGTERPCTVVVDSGTGTTAIGLALGAFILRLPWKITAVMLADTTKGYKRKEQDLISQFKRYFARDDQCFDHLLLKSNSDDMILVDWVDRHTPRKFGKILDREVKACQQIAAQTGVLVDPIYTMAAWEMATALCQEEGYKKNVVMIHTGGTLGLFGLAQRYNKSYFKSLSD